MKSSSMAISTLIILVMLVGNVFAGKWFFTQLVPQARVVLQTRLGVSIETKLSGVWSSAAGANDQDSQWWHALVIPGCHFLLMMGFMVFVLTQLLIVFLVAQRLSG